MKYAALIALSAVAGLTAACTDDGNYGNRSGYGYTPTYSSSSYAPAPAYYTPTPTYSSGYYQPAPSSGYYQPSSGYYQPVAQPRYTPTSADRNGDGIPDYRQRDADRDGVPNSQDRAPNNPYYR